MQYVSSVLLLSLVGHPIFLFCHTWPLIIFLLSFPSRGFGSRILLRSTNLTLSLDLRSTSGQLSVVCFTSIEHVFVDLCERHLRVPFVSSKVWDWIWLLLHTWILRKSHHWTRGCCSQYLLGTELPIGPGSHVSSIMFPHGLTLCASGGSTSLCSLEVVVFLPICRFSTRIDVFESSDRPTWFSTTGGSA